MWTRPRSPLAAPGEPALRTVEDATLTPFDHGRLRVAWRQPSWFVQGAVYDAAGRLLPDSQRVGGLSYDHALSADPSTLPEWGGRVRTLRGTWLYGGHWMNHFGHFLTETVTTLWPRADVDGVVFHPFWFGRSVADWQRSALRLAGIDHEPVVLGTDRVRVQRLLLPARPYVPNGYAHRHAVDVWRRMAAAAGPAEPPRNRVFLSRSAHNRGLAEAGRPSRRSAGNDSALDDLFAGRGYRVVHAEGLSLEEQVRLAAGAQVLAGVSGSALHLNVFAEPATRVVEVGDARGRKKPVLTQEILVDALGQELAFVPFARTPEGYDLADVTARLDELGV